MFSFIQIVFAFTFPFSAFRFNLSALTALRAIETASLALCVSKLPPTRLLAVFSYIKVASRSRPCRNA